MNKIVNYSLGVLSFFSACMCYATEKFEELPDLPSNLAFAIQPAEASSVSRAGNIGAQNITEPSMISVILSLFFVILLIYITGILYSKLNKVNFKTMKKQQGEFAQTQVTVLSTTQLGNNKSLHVVELDGKRMLIGTSASSIQLIKDLGNVLQENLVDDKCSHIEIPNIKIPRIEIPKIEIPTIDFSNLVTKTHNENKSEETKEPEDVINDSINESSETDSEIAADNNIEFVTETTTKTQDTVEHNNIVEDEDFDLYKKYLS